MAKSAKSAAPPPKATPTASLLSKISSRELVRQNVSNELVFGVVGPVGSGTSEIAEALKALLDKQRFTTTVLKASGVIADWASKAGVSIPPSPKMAHTEALQDAGDEFRRTTGDYAAVALHLIRGIRESRARQKGEPIKPDQPVAPDDKPRAFILDSLRHPAEVHLLRGVYQDAFCLVGVVCEEDQRIKRLTDKYRDAGQDKIDSFKRRDESADEKHGQHVGDTFHLSDFFVDNSEERFLVGPGEIKNPNPAWVVNDELGRLIDILTHRKIVRPRPSEAAMYHAYGARMSSACLSRQVGAALMDRQGNVVSTGTNEVPRAGGGVYGGTFIDNPDNELSPRFDHRCAFHGGFCRNTREQNDIITELMDRISEFVPGPRRDETAQKIRKTRIGQLMEFSRAVHAEMDALLSAARQGISTCGTRLFVTTFPCHNCARHIVAAGVDEVQFIEPFAKSKALPLHGDAVTTTVSHWVPPSLAQQEDDLKQAPQVLFRPFSGVAPRLYRRAFYKDRELKSSADGSILTTFPPQDGMAGCEPLRVSYAEMEARLVSAAEQAEASS